MPAVRDTFGLIVAAGLVLAGAIARQSPAEEKELDFDKSIAPLIAQRCLDCHNETEMKGGLDLSRRTTAAKGGDSGAAYSPGDLERSLLWQRVRDDEMPPEHPLPAKEKELLRAWIAGGATWGAERIDPFALTTDHRAGYDWWALQPLERTLPPSTEQADWVQNGIDRFILARLTESGLAPSPPADRRTLIRRLSFDLLGLPPTPEDIDAFLADERPGAYERLVDRLLASPQYGERWGRHWLDVIRFGESQGFERDKQRTNSWRYRDWVVDSFNRDTPYAEFVRMQLAGDVLREGDASAIVATGFLVAGAYDEVGQSQQSEAMKKVVRQDELEDIVSVVGQTFLGLTINCARCHDHKFDPIRQEEYYRLTAALAGVRHGEREAIDEERMARARRLAEAVDAPAAQLAARIDEIERPVREAILAERKAKADAAKPPQPLARWEFAGELRDAIGALHCTAEGSARAEEGRLVLDGSSFAASAPLERDLAAKTLEAWVRLDDLEQRGGGVMSVQSLDGGVFDAIVFGERQPQHWLAGSNHFERTESFGGGEEQAADKQLVHVAIVYQEDGLIAAYRNGQAYGKPYQKDPPITFKAGEAQVVFGLRHSPPGGNRLLRGAIERAQLYNRALSAEEIAASAGVFYDQAADEEIAARLDDEQLRRRESLRFELQYLRDSRDRYVDPKVYSVAPKQPEVAHVLKRGNTAEPGAVVAAGGVAALKGIDAEFGLEADAAEAERRKALAAWITDPNNPLFARVIVNRLWHYHFGVGLIETPNDFGFNGSRPSHPELLDWLALQMLQGDGGLKRLQRLIVTSAAYRQSSLPHEAGLRVDAGNRLLWRMSPRRLEAEAVRDAVLSAAGELNEQMGGPGYEDFTSYMRNAQLYETFDPVGASFQRRTVYRTWIRSARSRFLDAFDCPDPSTKTPRRAVTTTPLQALALLNNSFVLRMADRFAERLRRETSGDIAAQIGNAFLLAYGRPVSDEELAQAEPFVQRHGLAALCRVVLNSNEFLYVD